MRLSKLKLAGFKSFVDSTTIHFPSNRVGVVGPNGCGKSNVIDAVRWVMGESSAKNLRGSAMSDVIFNGSAHRQPVEQASIELIFEQVEEFIGQGNTEISVKRQITRDGQSEYFLNGVRCRRKDITDLFLGTGLGPRSYAIIEQGTISRLVEAKPDELRMVIEEAAGVSKYKEQRKETEQRMQQTRENIARLDEVRHELHKQLEKLQKQAKDAERFQNLKQSEHLLKAQLQAIRWRSLDTALQAQQQQIDEHSTLLQQDLLALHQLESSHKQQRGEQSTAQTVLNEVQERFYELETTIQRLEQKLEHSRERHEQLQWDLDQLEETWQEAKDHLESDEQQAVVLQTDICGAETRLNALQIAESTAQDTVQDAEAQLQEGQTVWDEFNLRAAEPTQRAQVERTQLQNIEQRIDQQQNRLLRLEEEAKGLDMRALEQSVAELETQMTDVQTRLEAAEAILVTHQAAVTNLREVTQQLSTRLHEQRTHATQLTGRLASLETLQESALGKNSADLNAWLHVHGLKDAPRLAESLQVEAGWERAVEIVLGAGLQALCIEDFTPLHLALEQPPQGRLALFATQWASSVVPRHSDNGLVPLSDKVKSTWSLAGLLNHVWAADTLTIAYRVRSSLLPHESLITPQGIWLGTNWLHSQQGSDERAGVLAREQEINRIAIQLNHLDKAVVTLTAELEQQRIALQQHEAQRDQIQRQVNELRQNFSQLQSQQGGKKARLDSIRAHIQRVTTEREELTQQLQADQQALTMTRQRLHATLAEIEQLVEEREKLSRQRDWYQERVLQARQAWQTTQQERHQVEVNLQALRTDLARLQQSIARAKTRLQQLSEQRYELQQDLAGHTDPLEDLHSELNDYQQRQRETEESLLQAKQIVAQLEAGLSRYDSEHLALTTRGNELRTSLEHMRVESQANQVRKQTVEEYLTALNLSATDLLAELPEYADEASWQSQIEAVERKLHRMGSVNMAALEEFTEQSKRKEFLDTQAEDLNNALGLLDSAIRTIDREMRSRFKYTIETVNANLQNLFPRLFGGGQASLELTDDDVLKAGVTIMARPPGKRNSSIHLLSGGEKALTAIALVFGIFQLNPAPFCMLDEVDAPLDDTNVGRFCALVKTMSERVQFIFISHNKITMEIADQLLGVTMQEAGVSRLVTVDIDAAIDLVTV